MRRVLFCLCLVTLSLALCACGNKGELVRPGTPPAAQS